MKDLASINVTDFLKKRGTYGANLLSVLGKQKQFVDALNTEIGKELLKDAMALMEDRLTRIIEEKSTEAERAEYRALNKIISAWSARLSSYYKGLDQIK